MKFRTVVLLADVQEFAYREIAEMLNVPPGTVKSRLSRGRKLLRIKLADYARQQGDRRLAPAAGGRPRAQQDDLGLGNAGIETDMHGTSRSPTS